MKETGKFVDFCCLEAERSIIFFFWSRGSEKDFYGKRSIVDCHLTLLTMSSISSSAGFCRSSDLTSLYESAMMAKNMFCNG